MKRKLGCFDICFGVILFLCVLCFTPLRVNATSGDTWKIVFDASGATGQYNANDLPNPIYFEALGMSNSSDPAGTIVGYTVTDNVDYSFFPVNSTNGSYTINGWINSSLGNSSIDWNANSSTLLVQGAILDVNGGYTGCDFDKKEITLYPTEVQNTSSIAILSLEYNDDVTPNQTFHSNVKGAITITSPIPGFSLKEVYISEMNGPAGADPSTGTIAVTVRGNCSGTAYWTYDNAVPITRTAKYPLLASTQYSFGTGSFSVAGDSTVYTGGNSFYVQTGGDYKISK